MTDRKSLHKQFYHMYKKSAPSVKSVSVDLKVGDGVRIACRDKTETFTKGYVRQTTEEIFTIDKIDKTLNPTTFSLKDLGGEPVTGIFYREELV